MNQAELRSIKILQELCILNENHGLEIFTLVKEMCSVCEVFDHFVPVCEHFSKTIIPRRNEPQQGRA